MPEAVDLVRGPGIEPGKERRTTSSLIAANRSGSSFLKQRTIPRI